MLRCPLYSILNTQLENLHNTWALRRLLRLKVRIDKHYGTPHDSITSRETQAASDLYAIIAIQFARNRLSLHILATIYYNRGNSDDSITTFRSSFFPNMASLNFYFIISLEFWSSLWILGGRS
jgi:hypothetical protein